ncbi:hypothetical protein ACWDO7_22625 [Streptomyces sp. NPDC003656]
MDTLTPPSPTSPEPTPFPAVPGHPVEAHPLPAAPEPASAPTALPTPPAGPACSACAAPAVVHWQRHPTDDELAALHQVEEDRRAHARLLADPQQDPPVFPPLPTAGDTLIAVYACGRHAITLEAAAHIHQSCCTAPNDADLPGCDCTPEPLPTAPETEEPRIELPAHWLPGDQ